MTVTQTTTQCNGSQVSTAAAVSIPLASTQAEAAAPQRPPGSILAAIGNTPLVEIKSLSRMVGGGRKIYGKCEHLNPGGSVKDRPALRMIERAEKAGLLKPGDTIVEGTGGNTGIGLALVAAAKGYKAVFAMPASIAKEKINSMKVRGPC